MEKGEISVRIYGPKVEMIALAEQLEADQPFEEMEIELDTDSPASVYIHAGYARGTDDMVESQIEHAENLARANNVAPGKVLKEMAGSSEFMAKFMGKNSLSMAETAVQAAKLGIEMSDISAMMDSILDIEGSIEKEMQVSVLLGPSIGYGWRHFRSN